jgi:Fe-S cluster assembly ATP-binding protein
MTPAIPPVREVPYTVEATGFRYVEAPSFARDGSLYFSEVRTGVVHRLPPGAGRRTTPFHHVASNWCNGTAFHRDGRLFLCDVGAACFWTLTPDGEATRLFDRYEDGTRLRGPNDCLFDQNGVLYFTDPLGSTLAEPVGHVGRWFPDGRVERIATGIAFSNGLALTPDERAKRGLFLAFQYPVAIPGVSLGNFMRATVNATHEKPVPALEFRRTLTQKMQLLKVDPAFATRSLNEGFSGGEKKRAEVLQMAMIQPKVAVMDETDSGLDIDALRVVAEGVNTITAENPAMGLLIITHYQRILNYLQPDFVHVLVKGRIVRSGGKELVEQLEREGYGTILAELGVEEAEHTNGQEG